MRSKTLSGSNSFSDLKRPVSAGIAIVEGTLVPSKVNLGSGYILAPITPQTVVPKTVNTPLPKAVRSGYAELSNPLVFHTTDGTVLYRYVTKASPQFSLFQKSTDLGATWTTLADPAATSGTYTNLVNFVANSTYVFLFFRSTNPGILRYTIASNTWSIVSYPSTISSIRRVYSTINGFILQGDDTNSVPTVYTCDTAGANFVNRLNASGYNTYGATFNYLNNGFSLISFVNNNNSSIFLHYISTNHGVSWTQVNSTAQLPYFGKISSISTNLAIHTYQKDVIIVKYFDTSNSNAYTLMMTTDGTTWTNITNTFLPNTGNGTGSFNNVVVKFGIYYLHLWSYISNQGSVAPNTIIADIYNTSFTKIRTLDLTTNPAVNQILGQGVAENNWMQGAPGFNTILLKEDGGGVTNTYLISEDTAIVNPPAYAAVDNTGAAISYYQKLA